MMKPASDDMLNDFDKVTSLWFDSKLANFSELAVQLYRRQLELNPLLAAWHRHTNGPGQINTLNDIRFLPVVFFKTHEVKSGVFEAEQIFSSSTTTGTTPALHHVRKVADYLELSRAGFERCYGPLNQYVFLALLPAYLERSGSSLVAMADYFIRESGQPESGFYLHDHQRLFDTLTRLQSTNRKVVLLGVTFALLDFAEHYTLHYPGLIVMETGGMKGRRKEMIREALHAILRSGFGVKQIHAEYGMTELMSQAYSTGDGRFAAPPWLKVILTDPTDPFIEVSSGQTGVINLIDLGNVNSCAFIQTQDLGRMHSDGTFEVLGRLDNSDLRGCSLLVS